MADPRPYDANARHSGSFTKPRKKTMEHPELAKEREFYRWVVTHEQANNCNS